MARAAAAALLLALLLVQQQRAADGGWVDKDTPLGALSTHSLAERDELFRLVFSDEFNVDGRSFHDGEDPRWTAIHKDDYTNFALQYYNRDLVTTQGGYLNITSVVQDVTFDVNDELSTGPSRKTKNYQSGMIQGWNKFCFTGGILEIRARLPGKAHVGGLWPAMWLLGNLARATYVGSSNNVWPWSYDECKADLQPQQLFSACNNVNHYDLHGTQGRGAPEIDLLEAMPGKEKLINTVSWLWRRVVCGVWAPRLAEISNLLSPSLSFPPFPPVCPLASNSPSPPPPFLPPPIPSPSTSPTSARLCRWPPASTGTATDPPWPSPRPPACGTTRASSTAPTRALTFSSTGCT